MPYTIMDEAIHLSKMGKGSLCSTIVTADDKNAKQYVLGAATHHGRILVLNNECAKESTGHGSPLPLLCMAARVVQAVEKKWVECVG